MGYQWYWRNLNFRIWLDHNWSLYIIHFCENFDTGTILKRLPYKSLPRSQVNSLVTVSLKNAELTFLYNLYCVSKIISGKNLTQSLFYTNFNLWLGSAGRSTDDIRELCLFKVKNKAATQPPFTFSNSTMETIEQCVNSVES